MCRIKWHSLSVISKKGNGGGAQFLTCRLKGTRSEEGEVRQSWVSTRGKTHLPVVRMKLQKGSVRQKRAHYTQWCPVGAEKLSSAKGQTSIVSFLTL